MPRGAINVKQKAVTHLGTVPIRELPGRSKPFLLRVTVAGKRRSFYFTTRAEAEKKWNEIALLASRPGKDTFLSVDRSLVTEREAAEYIWARDRLAEHGLRLADAVETAIRQAAGGDKR